MTRNVSLYPNHVKELPATTLQTQDTSTCTFPKSCRLDAHEEPFSKDDSVSIEHRPRFIGRGTRCFVAYESQTRQKYVFNGTWRAHSYTNTNSPPNPCLLLDCAISPHNIVSKSQQYIRSILDAIRTPLNDFHSTHALVSCVLHAVLGELLFIEQGAIT
ncbi:hypothetical protein CPB85DRAFT_1330103 [Mucidula mucida]|nr:hypothetical protein CPB85DRAFT_1330103 [Mucidula mucida]